MAQGKPDRFRRWRTGPSLFFPVALITAGVIWLLMNGGQAAPENVFRVLVYWPALLVAAGLAAILRPLSWILSALVWVAVGAVMVWFVLNPPVNLPGYTVPAFASRAVQEPLGDTRKASVVLDLSFNPVEVSVVDNNFFTAQVETVGELDYDLSRREGQTTIRLGEETAGVLFNLPAVLYESRSRPWKVGLTPDIPLNLTLHAGIGSAEVDLSSAQLSALQVDGSLGRLRIALPEDSGPYPFRLAGSTGAVSVSIPSGATLNMDIRAGVGSIDILLPTDSGVQVTVRSGGVGGLTLPEGFQKVRQGTEDDEGVWENEAFKTDDTPIRIELSLGAGRVSLR